MHIVVESVYQFDKLNVTVLGLITFFYIKRPVIIVKRLGIFNNLRQFKHSKCGLPLSRGIVWCFLEAFFPNYIDVYIKKIIFDIVFAF